MVENEILFYQFIWKKTNKNKAMDDESTQTIHSEIQCLFCSLELRHHDTPKRHMLRKCNTTERMGKVLQGEAFY